MSSLLNIIMTLLTITHAESAEGPCSLETSFGIQNITITDPNLNKAVYEGLGGNLTARYNALATEKFHFALRASFGYSELENKANTSALHENIQNTSWAPGLELRLYSLVMGAEYQSNISTIDMSGVEQHKLRTSFYSPQFFIAFDVPMDWWGLRLYYMRSEGDIPHLDTGLTSDSPWAQEQFLVALRINFRHHKESNNSYQPNTSDDSAQKSKEEPLTTYRPSRYFPRPSRSLGN